MSTSRCTGAFGLRRVVLGDEEHRFSQPFRLEHGRAADVESRRTIDATDEGPPGIVEQSLSAIQHTFASRLLSVRGLEEDEGYSSPFNRDPNAWGKACPSAFSRASSSPLLSPETSFQPKRSKARCHDLSWNIGLPLMEFSMRDTLRGHLNDGGRQSRQVRVQVRVQGQVLEPVRECWTTLAEQRLTLHPGYETTLPLQAKVKSVVVVPGRPTNPAGNPPSRQTRMAQRELDWEFEKLFYLDSVKKHISDNQARRRDVMTELVNLMTETNCSPGSSAPQPQHPSDLSRRNYQRRWRNLVPSVALQEWQLKHCETGKRFANVSDHFRSSLSSF